MENTIKFGTGGWRAVIGEDFICSNIRLVAAGILELMKSEKKRISRSLSDLTAAFFPKNAAKWVAEVLAHGGVTVWFMHRSVPTPLVMHTVEDKGLHYGIEITASHNPSEYNGIKLIVDEGRDAPLETTGKLEKIIEKLSDVKYTEFDTAVSEGKIVYLNNPFNKFLDDIIGLFGYERTA